jgi:hypothetical protein
MNVKTLSMPPAVNDSSNAAPAVVTSPSTVVTLGQSSTVADADTYTAQGLPSVAASDAWEYTRQDKVTLVMSSNFATSATASRFQGLGASLLSQLAESNKNISQSMIHPANGQALSPTALSAAQSKLHSAAENSVSLTIKTLTGKTVQFSLSSQDNGLAVTAEVSGGELDDDERNALAKMASGFQSAIDGLTADPPSVNLDGLTQYDSKVFSSVDLQSEFKLGAGQKQTLSFHADSDQRSVNMSGALGNLQVSVDLKNVAAMGTADQQDTALKAYLEQIDAAKTRGNGDAKLLSMFEGAFSSLHSHYPQTGNSTSSATDHAMLSGLADFSASVTQKGDAFNPLRPDELDAFTFDLSQTTRSKGSGPLNYSLTQDQHSHLKASFHKPSYTGDALALTAQNESQNYVYSQIDDQASSTSKLTYEKGALTAASVTQSASQSTHTSTYTLGRLDQDTITPVNATKIQNVLSALNSALQPDAKTSADGSAVKDTLSSIRAKAQLQADPAKLV